MRRRGDTNTPLWAVAYGWHSPLDGQLTTASPWQSVDEPTQAAWRTSTPPNGHASSGLGWVASHGFHGSRRSRLMIRTGALRWSHLKATNVPSYPRFRNWAQQTQPLGPGVWPPNAPAVQAGGGWRLTDQAADPPVGGHRLVTDRLVVPLTARAWLCRSDAAPIRAISTSRWTAACPGPTKRRRWPGHPGVARSPRRAGDGHPGRTSGRWTACRRNRRHRWMGAMAVARHRRLARRRYGRAKTPALGPGSCRPAVVGSGRPWLAGCAPSGRWRSLRGGRSHPKPGAKADARDALWLTCACGARVRPGAGMAAAAGCRCPCPALHRLSGDRPGTAGLPPRHCF